MANRTSADQSRSPGSVRAAWLAMAARTREGRQKCVSTSGRQLPPAADPAMRPRTTAKGRISTSALSGLSDSQQKIGSKGQEKKTPCPRTQLLPVGDRSLEEWRGCCEPESSDCPGSDSYPDDPLTGHCAHVVSCVSQRRVSPSSNRENHYTDTHLWFARPRGRSSSWRIESSTAIWPGVHARGVPSLVRSCRS